MSEKKGVLGMLTELLGAKEKEKAAGACCSDQTVNLKPIENSSCCGGPQNVIRLDDQFEISEATLPDGAAKK